MGKNPSRFKKYKRLRNTLMLKSYLMFVDHGNFRRSSKQTHNTLAINLIIIQNINNIDKLIFIFSKTHQNKTYYDLQIRPAVFGTSSRRRPAHMLSCRRATTMEPNSCGTAGPGNASSNLKPTADRLIVGYNQLLVSRPRRCARCARIFARSGLHLDE